MPTTSELEDIQGNIVEGYRLPCVAHLFGSVTAHEVVRWRRLLAELVDQITTAEAWSEPPLSTLNVGLSYAALAEFESGLAGEIKPYFPAFAAGMAKRAALLGDTDDFDENRWRDHHVWLAVHARSEQNLSDRVDALKLLASSFGITLHAEGPPGLALTDRVGDREVWREHFGFRDDISNPALADWPRRKRHPPDEYYAGRGKTVDGKWVGIAAGEFLLGHDNEAGEDPMQGLSDPARRWFKNATFGVFRKLRQDVPGFRAFLASQATPEASAAYLASQMMGRNHDGVPVGTPDAENLQRFTYEHDKQGAGCPLGAHVRRANPRTSGRHRLFRRGMTYGPPLPQASADDGVDRGLWFVGFNANIEDQFELIQRQWLNGPSGSLSNATDPISSTQATRNLVIEGDHQKARMPRLVMNIPRFVTCLGGEYYVVPSRQTLRQLADANARYKSSASGDSGSALEEAS